MTAAVDGTQRRFADLGTPLADVTFCVLDLETTGGSPTECAITEVGAVKLQGGESLGTFQTMVNPGTAIPPEITVLTGITQAMVVGAPRIESVLPALLEFVGDAVVVGHNVHFDIGFLRAALERSGRPPLENPSVDTCRLARRLLADEVPNCRLATLAGRLRLSHSPTHRALDDALATGDLLHVLLERAAALGVLGLDDLLALPTIAGHPQAAKLRLTNDLPRRPGVYLFRDRTGTVLYVGRATDLRSRVRSYFSAETRRKVGQLLRELHSIDHVVCTGPLEAAVVEVRLIHAHRPRFNRAGTRWRRYRYLKLTPEPFPRLSIVRAVRPDGATYLGPLPSHRNARLVADAIECAVPLRRCTKKPGRSRRTGPCAPAQLGVATCPCAGDISEARYGQIVERVRVGLTTDPSTLLAPLRARIDALAGSERFEEAADLRDRARALSAALRRQRLTDDLRLAGRVVIDLDDRGGAEVVGGRLVRAWGPDRQPALLPVEGAAPQPSPAAPEPEALSTEDADEVTCIAGWLRDEAHRVRVVHADRGLSAPVARVPSFEPRRARSGVVRDR